MTHGKHVVRRDQRVQGDIMLLQDVAASCCFNSWFVAFVWAEPADAANATAGVKLNAQSTESGSIHDPRLSDDGAVFQLAHISTSRGNLPAPGFRGLGFRVPSQESSKLCQTSLATPGSLHHTLEENVPRSRSPEVSKSC